VGQQEPVFGGNKMDGIQIYDLPPAEKSLWCWGVGMMINLALWGGIALSVRALIG
jgi:hypothetical protein